ncbi:MAG: hypothetical protein AAGE84_09295 [Cyanobacteria bacterium P01_G01_bin.39]
MKLIASGTTEEVLTNANINQAYKRSLNLYQQPLNINHSVNANLAH